MRSCRRQFGEIEDFPFIRCYMTRRARLRSNRRVPDDIKSFVNHFTTFTIFSILSNQYCLYSAGTFETSSVLNCRFIFTLNPL